MTVRAKFKVQSITEQEHWDKSKGSIFTVKLSPVIGGSLENQAFYAATPGGYIDLSTLGDVAGRNFKVGQEFYVDFTPAE